MFGQSTGGFTTGNSVFPLLDGSILMIESDVSLDADGNAHTGPIEPDVKVMSRASGGAHSSDETIVTAEAWLLDGPPRLRRRHDTGGGEDGSSGYPLPRHPSSF